MFKLPVDYMSLSPGALSSNLKPLVVTVMSFMK